MLPILLLEIFYKVLWLIIVAYPLWSKGRLAGSLAEGITSAFLWVILPIVAVPWRYAFVNYIYKPKKESIFSERDRNRDSHEHTVEISKDRKLAASS
jgi:hypothetical protein